MKISSELLFKCKSLKNNNHRDTPTSALKGKIKDFLLTLLRYKIYLLKSLKSVSCGKDSWKENPRNLDYFSLRNKLFERQCGNFRDNL